MLKRVAINRKKQNVLIIHEQPPRNRASKMLAFAICRLLPLQSLHHKFDQGSLLVFSFQLDFDSGRNLLGLDSESSSS